MVYRLTLVAQHIARFIPRSVRWWIGGLLAQMVYFGWHEKRLATQKNMSVVLGLPLHDAHVHNVARLSWRNYGRYIGDFFDLSNHPAQYYLDMLDNQVDEGIRAVPIVHDVLSTYPGRGILVPTGHLGNWDVAGIVLASISPLHALAEPFADPRLSDLILGQREQFGMSIITTGDSLRVIMRLMRDGGILATPIDRPVSAEEGVPVQFFGRTAYVPRGLGAIATKTQAIILPGFVYYIGNHAYGVRLFPAVPFTASDDAQKDIQRASQIMFDALEEMIRRDPTQWYMFRSFWPDEDNQASTILHQPTLSQVQVMHD